MTDLRNHFEGIAGPVSPPTAEQVAADLTRGRRALRRRRTRQTAAGSSFAVAALVAAFAVAANGDGTAPGAPVATGTGDRSSSAAAVKLVAYQGEQPKGFTIDTVPDGWFVQSDDNYNLVLAPNKVKKPGPNVNPSTDPVYDEQTFVGKIAIFLESKDQSGPSREGTTVQVGDQKGVLLKSLRGETPDGPAPTAPGGDTGWELWVKQPAGVYLIIQYWQGIGLTRDQILEIGRGVHVHKDAKQGVG